jgi:hypothetical protein
MRKDGYFESRVFTSAKEPRKTLKGLKIRARRLIKIYAGQQGNVKTVEMVKYINV